MSRFGVSLFLVPLLFSLLAYPVVAQENGGETPAVENAAEVEAGTPAVQEDAKPEAEPANADAAKEKPDVLSQQLEDIQTTVDDSETAKETTAGILTPIYRVAEALEFPAFHWIAFALMLAGVIGFGLQLVIGKLVVMAHLGFSVREILSDVLSFVISLVGLVLTTQAAAQNSTFTESPFAVLSASVVGLLLGALLYFWGQAQEVEAVKGRKATLSEKQAKGAH